MGSVERHKPNNNTVVRGPGRNDQCPCGSGAKYKRCCGPGGTSDIRSVVGSARRLYEGGRIQEAEAFCHKALARQPDRADMLHLLGMIALQTGRNELAHDVLSAALRSAPANAPARNHLGVACLALKREAEARDCFLRSLALDSRQAEVHNNLAIALKELGDFQAAESSYREALAIDPRYAPAQYNLGAMLLYLGRIDEAVAGLQQTLAIKPAFPAARRKLAAALGCQGEVDAAIDMCRSSFAGGGASTDIYWQIANDLTMLGMMQQSLPFLRKSVELDPANAAAAQLLAAFGGTHPERLEAGYVRTLFDDQAERFESHLVKGLQYSVPCDLVALVENHAERAGPWDVLDLGCGTGLVGTYIARHARRLVGVDLSPRMLDQARKLNLYHALECAEVHDMLQASETATYDVIVAADVFIYIGRLEEIASQARRLLRPGGVFAFSVEEASEALGPAADQGDCPGYRLDLRTRRYVHEEEYLRTLAARNQMRVTAAQHSRLRLEREQPVIGRLVVWEA